MCLCCLSSDKQTITSIMLQLTFRRDNVYGAMKLIHELKSAYSISITHFILIQFLRD